MNQSEFLALSAEEREPYERDIELLGLNLPEHLRGVAPVNIYRGEDGALKLDTFIGTFTYREGCTWHHHDLGHGKFVFRQYKDGSMIEEVEGFDA